LLVEVAAQILANGCAKVRRAEKLGDLSRVFGSREVIANQMEI
jgi:hypothetical protein